MQWHFTSLVGRGVGGGSDSWSTGPSAHEIHADFYCPSTLIPSSRIRTIFFHASPKCLFQISSVAGTIIIVKLRLKGVIWVGGSYN